MIIPGPKAARAAADTDFSDITTAEVWYASWTPDGSGIEVIFSEDLTPQQERRIMRRLITETTEREVEVDTIEAAVANLEDALAAGGTITGSPSAQVGLITALKAAYPELSTEV